jgi:hypothetical protein
MLLVKGFNTIRELLWTPIQWLFGPRHWLLLVQSWEWWWWWKQRRILNHGCCSIRVSKTMNWRYVVVLPLELLVLSWIYWWHILTILKSFLLDTYQDRSNFLGVTNTQCIPEPVGSLRVTVSASHCFKHYWTLTINVISSGRVIIRAGVLVRSKDVVVGVDCRACTGRRTVVAAAVCTVLSKNTTKGW